jgi:hypothetical protein
LVINLIFHTTSHVGLLSPLGDKAYDCHDEDKDLEDDIITETAVAPINFDSDKKLICDEVFQVEYRSGEWLEEASRNDQPGTRTILVVRVMPARLPSKCVPEGFSQDVNMRDLQRRDRLLPRGVGTIPNRCVGSKARDQDF